MKQLMINHIHLCRQNIGTFMRGLSVFTTAFDFLEPTYTAGKYVSSPFSKDASPVVC